MCPDSGDPNPPPDGAKKPKLTKKKKGKPKK